MTPLNTWTFVLGSTAVLAVVGLVVYLVIRILWKAAH